MGLVGSISDIRSKGRRRGKLFAVGSGALPPVTLPSGVVARFSADDITPQTDNTNLASWTDSIAGVSAAQGTGARQPKYRTGGANGKPYVGFTGTQFLTIAGTSNDAYTPLTTANYTVYVVYRNPAVTTWGFLFAASPSGGQFFLSDDGKTSGRKAGTFGSAGAGRMVVPAGTTGLMTQFISGRRPADASTGRAVVNGSAYIGSSPRATQAINIGGWSDAPDSFGFSGEIYEVIIWNRGLSHAEMMQAMRWAHTKYNAALPWAASGAYRVFDGNSQTDGGYETSPDKRYPMQVAAINGWPLGTWTNLGQSGASWAARDFQAAAEIDAILAELGATPGHLAVWEYYNQARNVPVGSVASVYGAANTYLANRIAAGWRTGNNKIAFGTSIDAADGLADYSEATRTAYNAYWDVSGNRAGKMDAYVAIHNDTGIGTSGACPNSAPFTPNFHTDGIHMIDAGNAILAGLFATALASL